MLLVVHKVASWFLKRRMEQIERFMRRPHQVQDEIFHTLLLKGQGTQWGKKHGYHDIRTVAAFQRQVPISSYEQLYPWIEKAFEGQPDILWPGKTIWFSKSSGTTNDKSKYIPVSSEAMEESHFKAGQDLLSFYLHNKPDSKLFTGKSLSIGGSHEARVDFPNIHYGDVSAVITENLPRFFELARTPSRETALMPEWESKLEAMAKELIHEDVTGIAGVPTWTLVLINYLMDQLNLPDGNLLNLWPNLELYLHGGVSFAPYRDQFKQLIPSDQMTYLDCYNASEGFFGFQHEFDASDLLLLLDHGIFYEFLPLEYLGEEHPKTHTLEEVEIGRTYALVISTNGGLWRYNIGDTIQFTGKDPFRFKIVGRTKQFINAFGEELMVDNAEVAITKACRATESVVANYTVAPIYLEGRSKGGHEWLIEFEKAPTNMEQFRQILDATLQHLNSDYEAKRQKDLALVEPLIHSLPTGTFLRWMKKRGKLGGQHKVPRLANDRKYVDDILGDLHPTYRDEPSE